MLKRVRIKNFRSLDIDVELEPLTVLVGRSGSGKTNFVEALRFLRDRLRSHIFDRPRESDAENIISLNALPPFSFLFELTFSIQAFSDDDFNYRVEWCGLDAEGRYKEGKGRRKASMVEELSLGNNVIFSREDDNWKSGTSLTTRLVSGQLVLGMLTGCREANLAYDALSNGIGCYSFPGTVLKISQQNDKDRFGLNDLGENYLAVLSAISTDTEHFNDWNDIIAALRCLNTSITSMNLEMPLMQKVVVSHQMDRRNLQLPIDSESEGFRRFLAHLIALYQIPRKRVLLFEEPENGIHPGALEVLADQFKACPDTGRGQVILTTHSPDLLDHFDVEQIRVVDIDNHVTRIGPVSEEQIEAVQEDLLRPGELLTVDPARIAQTERTGA